jgi:hypothetical protein
MNEDITVCDIPPSLDSRCTVCGVVYEYRQGEDWYRTVFDEFICSYDCVEQYERENDHTV